jgi:triacylglycerol lipase
MIATKHHGRTCRLAAAFAAGATIASGYGSPAAWADSSEPASSGAWTLLDASNDFAPTIGAASPAADASSGALINELMTATQGVSSDAAIPASSTGDGLFSSLLAFIDGVSPPPSAPGDLVTFSGSSSLFNTLLVSAFDSLEPLEKDLGTNFSAELAPLISSASPPAWLESSAGLTVTETQYDGMPVYDLTPADPSGDYVVAIHGGAFIDQPSIVNWLAYTDMAENTNATIVVPIYPLATDGGTAGTVDPEIASLISSEIASEGAGNVSVYGDSAGGEIALEAVQQLAGAGDAVPHSMVLDSPALDLSLSNPNIAFVNDPILGNAGILQDDELWAGNLPLTDPEVSPLYGSLDGLPPTYVYAGSDDLLAPDVLRLEQDAVAQDAPFSFILRNGELHDWALQPFGDGGQVQDQIYQELGLTDATSSAATANPDLLDTLANSLQTLSTELSSQTFSSGSLLGDLSTDLANALAATSTEVTGLSTDLSAIVADVMTAF